eukprot:TRINITY_DN4560_c0_g1_i1.p1 TRINITY_DN4560_c0_g1~~TRINITY_DN4560_c0_g1_i1.p1  ORF type:complete len:138 (+),score=25.47 TRINITY_DN4560_c0_g1_i1:147-560(+)
MAQVKGMMLQMKKYKHVPRARRKGWQMKHHQVKGSYLQGTVVGTFQNKTIRVAVDRLLVHQKYYAKKTLRTVLMVHDELNEAVRGDKVIMQQTRRYSKKKFWHLHSISEPYKPLRYLKENPDVADAIKKIEEGNYLP